MKEFNKAYKTSKSQFLTDMKCFNAAELNKEDEIIERSIKDSNYYPDNTTYMYQAAERNNETLMKNEESPDIEMSSEASNFKATQDHIEIGVTSELKIK